VSQSSLGVAGIGASGRPDISNDGRYVAFHSDAPNLVLGDTNGRLDVFVHDRETGELARVSVSTAGEEGSDGSFWAAINGDGGHIAFTSSSPNLVPGDTNGMTDIFVRER